MEAQERETLRKMSKHVAYEWDMLVDLANLLPGLEGAPNKLVRYACIESFLMHARQLLLFLYEGPTRKRDDDVYAVQYAETWVTVRPKEVPPSLLEMKDAVDKRVAHVTTRRVDESRYKVEEWARALAILADSFLAKASDDLFVAKPDSKLTARLNLPQTKTGSSYVTSTATRDDRPVFIPAVDVPEKNKP
jgi:hypothetical protein